MSALLIFVMKWELEVGTPGVSYGIEQAKMYCLALTVTAQTLGNVAVVLQTFVIMEKRSHRCQNCN